MKSWQDMKALKGVRDELKDMDIFEHKPGKIDSLKKFFDYYGYSWKMMFKEKELFLFLFIFLQWVSVALGVVFVCHDAVLDTRRSLAQR